MEQEIQEKLYPCFDECADFKKYGNIMIDLETLSTKTNASIIEIGAVEFNKETGETGAELDILISPSEWTKYGRHVDGDTIKWWMGQDKSATERFFQDSAESDKTLYYALCRLESFVRACDNCDKQTQDKERVVVWGNGSTMDITILQSAYEYHNWQTPWQYWAVNDVRTIVNLNPSIKENMKFDSGVKHSAIADCKHQIKYLVETLKSIRKN